MIITFIIIQRKGRKIFNSVYNIKHKVILIIKRKEMSNMNSLGWMIAVIVCIYIAVCFGKVAAKHGKNPILFGILSIISPINLIILGYWAFSDFESQKKA